MDAELYLPEDWFTAEMAELREKLGIPAERKFKTKIELGWEMIQRAHANGLPFEAICCDDFYGKSGDFRAEMRAAGFVYMADVPHNTRVYLKRPAWLKCQRYLVASEDELRKAEEIDREVTRLFITQTLTCYLSLIICFKSRTRSALIFALLSPPQTIPRTPIISGAISFSFGTSSNLSEPASAVSSPSALDSSTKRLSSSSLMNSSVERPSFIPVSSIATSMFTALAISATSKGEIEFIRL
ncbi:MAG: transposase [Methanophagales archaeon]|nr:transposase [Methanophagales archaeon]